mgnify:CR=1 FL=1|tara:strand:+ start:170 stop:1117 length:948 start_codon:yes stop_codon:yes gene_type:complete
MDFKELEQSITKKLFSKTTPKIFKEPFPHIIIDDFFPKDFFKLLHKANVNMKDIKKSFTGVIENKKVFSVKGLDTIASLPIQILGGKLGKRLVNHLTYGENEYEENDLKVLSMNDFEEYGGYYPFHTMTSGGILGSHVDHSNNSNQEYTHFANIIYYSHEDWKSDWGGSTLLFDKFGFKIIKKVFPRPNRLIVFLHFSSTSFHGVDKIFCPKGIERNTYYMDYYLDNNDFQNCLRYLNKNKPDKFRTWYHGTTFIPFLPLGLKKFSFKNFFDLTNFTYIYYYVLYVSESLINGISDYMRPKKLLERLKSLKNYVS